MPSVSPVAASAHFLMAVTHAFLSDEEFADRMYWSDPIVSSNAFVHSSMDKERERKKSFVFNHDVFYRVEKEEK